MFCVILDNKFRKCMRLIAIIPTKEQLLDYLSKNPHQTYTSLAKHFGLEMGTVRDLIRMYKDSLSVVKIGTALMVDVKEVNS